MSRNAGVVRVGVVGAGAFGRNHLRVYRELEQAGFPVELVAVVDPDEAARERAAADFGVRGFRTIAECLANPTHGDEAAMNGAPGVGKEANTGVLPLHFVQGQDDGGKIDAASVCVPTVQHAACARELMAAGVDLLIEKPLAASLAEADEIVRLARELGRVVQVGHLERFNPAVRAVMGLLNRPMFFEVHRLSVFTPRSLDVDVVLDLMIHDLDIVMKLVGQPVREVRAVGLPVLSKKVDIANVRLEFENGCVANFTASRVSTERVRKVRFFQPHQYLSLDFARQDLLLIDVTAVAGMDLAQLAAMVDPTRDGKDVTNGAPGAADPTRDGKDVTNGAPGAADPTRDGETVTNGAPSAVGAHPTPGMVIRKVAVEAGEPLRLEIEAFLEAVRTRTEPVVTVEDGRAALGLALEINASIAAHARRTGL